MEGCLTPIMDHLVAFKDGRLPYSIASSVYDVLRNLWKHKRDAAVVAIKQRFRHNHTPL